MGGTGPDQERVGVPRQKVNPPAPVGIVRPRLTTSILGPPEGVRLVVGPAGSGKTTALAHAAAACEGRCLWLSLDGTDRHPASFARTLAAATSLGAETDVLGVVSALDDGDPTLVVVDDVHQVVGSPAGEAVELLCRYRPPQVTVALGARDLRELHQWRWWSEPSSRLIDVDQLRFRLWEVDELFRHLDSPLGPADVHALARRTDGWAVALRLFHVVLREAPGDAASLLARSPRFTHRSIRGYLREEVLARVSPDQRAFLTRTAVFDRLVPACCDALLDHPGSLAQLDELSACGLVAPEADGSSYRLHELVRDHLLAELSAEVGDDAVSALHRKAADLLEREGAVRDAIRSAARGGDWDTLRRLLRLEPGEGTPLHGVPEIPASVRDHDPWVLRAEAIRLLNEGDLAGARRALRSAVERSALAGADQGTANLLRGVDAWLRPTPGSPRSWMAALRAALAGGEVPSWTADQGGRFGRGVADLVAGRIGDARAALAGAATGPNAHLSAMAAVALAVGGRLAGDGDGEAHGRRAVAVARAAGSPAVLAAADLVAAGAAATTAPAGGGEVGRAFQVLWSALARLTEEAPTNAPEPAVAVLAAQSLVVPESVVLAAELVAAAGRGADVAGDVRAPRFRAAGPLAHALASLAAGLAGDRAAGDAAHRLAAAHGFGAWLQAVERCQRADRPGDPGTGSGAPAPGTGGAALALQVLGGFAVRRHGVPLDVSLLRPRHLELLQLLALDANHWVHRESLWELLWSDRPPEAASHNLHVAVSAVRRLLEPQASRGRSSLLQRSGDRYRLAVPTAHCDVCRFENHLHGAAEARRAGALADAADELRLALREWRGEPVPAAGPAEWAVGRRENLRRRFAEVAADVLGQLAPTVHTSTLAAHATAVEPADEVLWRIALEHARRAGAGARLRELRAAYALRETGAAAGRPTHAVRRPGAPVNR